MKFQALSRRSAVWAAVRDAEREALAVATLDRSRRELDAADVEAAAMRHAAARRAGRVTRGAAKHR